MKWVTDRSLNFRARKPKRKATKKKPPTWWRHSHDGVQSSKISRSTLCIEKLKCTLFFFALRRHFRRLIDVCKCFQRLFLYFWMSCEQLMGFVVKTRASSSSTEYCRGIKSSLQLNHFISIMWMKSYKDTSTVRILFWNMSTFVFFARRIRLVIESYWRGLGCTFNQFWPRISEVLF